MRDAKCIQVLVGKPERKIQLRIYRRKCQDNIRMNPREIGWEDVEWMHLAQDSDQWQALVNTVMNRGFHERWGIS
jgi:hypothetical protein